MRPVRALPGLRAALAAALCLPLLLTGCGDDDEAAPAFPAADSQTASASGSGSSSASGSNSLDGSTARPEGELTAEEAAAVSAYREYLAAQVEDSISVTEELVAALKADDVDEAKSLYAPSRIGWESIEPVAAAFGDIDPKVDLREADLEDGDVWTGWHVIEKSLWEDESTEDMGKVGDQLLTDLRSLRTMLPDAELDPVLMANGAKELLDEIAAGKITGEEEAFSHTDLVDFEANLDGARKVFDLLVPLAEENDLALVDTIATEFDNVETALAEYAEGDGYVSYDTVTEAQRKELSDVVNALAEPLSRLAAAVA